MSKTLRVRLPSGRTHRIQVDRNEDFSTFLAKVYSLGEKLIDASLFCDPSFQQPFSMSSATHGMMIFVKAQKESSNANEASSSAAAAPTSSPSGSNPNPKPSTHDSKRSDPGSCRLRSRHGPRGMCEQCMPKEDKRERYESEIRKWKGRGMSVAVMEAREALKHKIVSQDEPHLSAAVVSDSAGHAFQAYLAQIGFSQQRLGYCYGRVNDENETEIHAIFEPMQNGDDKCYNVIESEAADEGATRASAIAEQLGLSQVGIVFSACPRKSILSGADLVFAAKFASKLTEEQRKGFVVLVVFVTENGETVFEAYQISDLAIELSKNNVFEGFDKQKKNGGRVLCTEEVLVEGKDTKKVHTEFFLLNIPIKKLTSWLATDFPVENRELQPQRPQHLSEALSKASEPYYRRISDFHLLLFLSDTFQVDTDMPGLTTCVREQEGEVEEGYQLMIQSLANAS